MTHGREEVALCPIRLFRLSLGRKQVLLCPLPHNELADLTPDPIHRLKKGRIWVTTDDAVVAGAVANLKLSSGLFTDEAVAAGIEAFTQFNARFLTATSGSALALVEIK